MVRKERYPTDIAKFQAGILAARLLVKNSVTQIRTVIIYVIIGTIIIACILNIT